MCSSVYIWQERTNKKYRERIWFERWIKEGYSIRQLSDQSGWGQTKIKEIKAHWLSQAPPQRRLDLTKASYLIFDGTYFHSDLCLMLLYDSAARQVLSSRVVAKESYRNSIGWFYELREHGLNPAFITMDGNTQVMRAAREVFEEVVIQRCLYHIKRQSEMWLRQHPKTELARELKYLLKGVCCVESHEDKEKFFASYACWRQTHEEEIKKLRAKDKVEGDIIRAYRMVENAYSDMFHYLDDRSIERTSNQLESFFSHLKRRYRQHAGLRRENLENYLKWYIYLNSTR